jgi:hypothetical protein
MPESYLALSKAELRHLVFPFSDVIGPVPVRPARPLWVWLPWLPGPVRVRIFAGAGSRGCQVRRRVDDDHVFDSLLQNVHVFFLVFSGPLPQSPLHKVAHTFFFFFLKPSLFRSRFLADIGIEEGSRREEAGGRNSKRENERQRQREVDRGTKSFFFLLPFTL